MESAIDAKPGVMPSCIGSSNTLVEFRTPRNMLHPSLPASPSFGLCPRPQAQLLSNAMADLTAELKAKARQVAEERDTVEAEITAIHARLQAPGQPGLKGSLLDSQVRKTHCNTPGSTLRLEDFSDRKLPQLGRKLPQTGNPQQAL